MNKKISLIKMEDGTVDEDVNTKFIVKFINEPLEVSLEDIVWDAYVEEMDQLCCIGKYLLSYGYAKNVIFDDKKTNKFIILLELTNILYCIVDEKDFDKRWIKYDLKNNKAYFVGCTDESDSFYFPLRKIGSFSDKKVVEYIEKNIKRS